MKKTKKKRIKVEVLNSGTCIYYPQYRNEGVILNNITFILTDIIMMVPELIFSFIAEKNLLFGFYRKFGSSFYENYKTGILLSRRKVSFFSYSEALDYLRTQTTIELNEIEEQEKQRKEEQLKKIKKVKYIYGN